MRTSLLTFASTATFIVLCFFVALELSEKSKRASTISPYREELASIAVTYVTIDGIDYTVSRGRISPSVTLNSRLEWRVLRLAYAHERIRRSPLFTLTTADTRALVRSLDTLEQVLERIALLQKSEEDAEHVRNALYPIPFLRSLSHAEETRRTFLRSRTEGDLFRYEQALQEAVRHGVADSERFAVVFADYLMQREPFTIVSAAGVYTRDDMLRAASSLPHALRATASAFDKQSVCFRGAIEQCAQDSFAVPVLTLAASEKSPAFESTTAQEVREILGEVNESADLLGTPIILSSSVCIGAFKGPYRFLIDTSLPLVYQDDIFFRPLVKPAGVNQYLAEELGLRYAYVNMVKFYTCPDVLADIGLARAVALASFAAENHPELAEKERFTFLDRRDIAGELAESEARAYVDAALREVLNDERASNELIRTYVLLALAFEKRSAGLDLLVQDIAETLGTDVLLFGQEVPFDLSAGTLFMTHSAFPSLFLQHQNPDVRLADPNNTNISDILAEHFTTYSRLRTFMPRSRIVEEMRGFFEFEDTF